MRGGMKVYAGSPAAARAYLEADRGRADDYYLTEGTGLARRFVARRRAGGRAGAAGGATATRPGWPAAIPTPVTRGGGCAPTSVRCASSRWWSTARSPGRWPPRCTTDVAAAYDAAQDRAAAQIIGWLAAARDHPGRPARRAGAGAGGDPGGGDGAALHLPRRRPAPASAPADRRPGVRRRAMARAAHRRRSATSSPPSTESGTPRSPATRNSAPPWPRTATPWTRLEKYGSSPPTSVRSAPGRRRSGATWTATNATGQRRTPENSPVRRCGGPGTPAPGPTAARTRSPRVPGPTSTARWRAELAALGYRAPDRPVQLRPTPIGVAGPRRAPPTRC